MAEDSKDARSVGSLVTSLNLPGSISDNDNPITSDKSKSKSLVTKLNLNGNELKKDGMCHYVCNCFMIVFVMFLVYTIVIILFGGPSSGNLLIHAIVRSNI